MRTIPEVAEDIKSILNNIERTEECTGETLVDINELVDEMLTINCYKDKPKSNADRIRSMSDEELAEFINFGSPDCSRHCADFKPGCSFSCNHNHGNDVILNWLQSEAE